MGHFEKIIPSRLDGLPAHLLPFEYYSKIGKDRKEKILWRDIFHETTSKYHLIGSGKYFHISGVFKEFEFKESKEISKKFTHYGLDGVILIHDLDKEFICGGMLTDYSTKNLYNSKNPLLESFFTWGGEVFQTDEEKNTIIGRYIEGILGNSNSSKSKKKDEEPNSLLRRIRQQKLRRCEYL